MYNSSNLAKVWPLVCMMADAHRPTVEAALLPNADYDTNDQEVPGTAHVALDVAEDGQEEEQDMLHDDHVPASRKRKQPEAVKNRFKVMASVVMAMRRFQAALNPTYTYGKRASESGVSGDRSSQLTTSGSKRTVVPTSNEQVSTATSATAYTHRGHKTHYLFSPLPDTAEAQS